MTRESIEWLNNNVLMGYGDDRERWAGGWTKRTDSGLSVPWHATADYTGSFPGPIPIEAVNERLFNWEAELHPVLVDFGMGGVTVPADKWQAVTRSDNSQLLHIFRDTYEPHQYSEWLLDTVANLIDTSRNELGIESALQLQGGGVAAVSISLPDIVEGDAGFPLLSKLLAFTSLNGRFKTTYKRTNMSPVCDNSLDVAMRGKGAEFKVAHTKGSGVKLAEARQVLGILWQQADEMVEFFDKLAEWQVTNDDFRAVLDTIEPQVEVKIIDGKVTNQRAVDNAVARREELVYCYKFDPRCAPWDGTALGTFQAFNTWDQQVKGGIRGERVERQMLGTLGSDVASFDGIVLDALSDVTGWHVEQAEDRHFALVAN